MNLRVNRLHFPVTTLGPGRRIGIWLQGCTVGCRGCLSPDTWDPDPATEVAVDSVVEACRQFAPRGVDGVTISGGEPFEQPDGLAALLDGLHAWREELGLSMDLLCYSGLSLTRLELESADVLARLDAVIPEPFVLGRSVGRPWRGSDNQPIIALTALGEERYGSPVVEDRVRLQVDVSPERILLIGIPDRGDLERHREALVASGVRTVEQWCP